MSRNKIAYYKSLYLPVGLTLVINFPGILAAAQEDSEDIVVKDTLGALVTVPRNEIISAYKGLRVTPQKPIRFVVFDDSITADPLTGGYIFPSKQKIIKEFEIRNFRYDSDIQVRYQAFIEIFDAAQNKRQELKVYDGDNAGAKLAQIFELGNGATLNIGLNELKEFGGRIGKKELIEVTGTSDNSMLSLVHAMVETSQGDLYSFGQPIRQR